MNWLRKILTLRLEKTRAWQLPLLAVLLVALWVAGFAVRSLGEAEAELARGAAPGTRTQNNFRSPGGAQQISLEPKFESALHRPFRGSGIRRGGRDPGFHPALIIPRPLPRASEGHGHRYLTCRAKKCK